MNLNRLPRFVMTLLLAVSLTACNQTKEKKVEEPVAENSAESAEPFFKISLAQWSLSKPIMEGDLDPMDFPEKASEMGFEAIEYVSAFYGERAKKADNPELALQGILDTLKAKSEEFEVQNVLIMVDGEGDLASSSEEERNQAVENHKKWVDAAQFLGCHSIRVNLFGSTEPEEWKKNSIDGLTKLSEYAATKNINVLVENHGYLSSNAALLAEVFEAVENPNCGSLPDFGNFCLKREGGALWEAACIEEYPRYQGVEELMPYAFAVSAKSYDFNEEGEETTIDYERMLQIVEDAGYTGHIGIEYEGTRLSAEEGIQATRDLLVEVGTRLNQQ